LRHLQINTRPQLRGAEVFSLQLAKELRRLGHEAHSLFLYETNDAVQLPTGEQDILLAADYEDLREKAPGFQPALLRKLKRALAGFDPEVIQLNGSRAVKYGALLRAFRQRRGCLVYRSIGDPQVWSGPAWKQALYSRLVVSRMDGIIAVSANTERGLRRCYAPRAPIEVIPRGVDLEALKPRTERNEIRSQIHTPSNATVAIAVGRLSHEKRPLWLLEALAPLLEQRADLHLWYLGDGAERGALAQQIQARGLGAKVRLLGFQSHVGDYLAAADLLTLASSTEGAPGVILEAGALGRPAVATEVGGVSDLVRAGETGLLVSLNDATVFRNAVERLLDGSVRRGFAERAQEFVLSNFSIAAITQRALRFYQRLGATSDPLDVAEPK
jgi:glycosyltransferase involved in cell wall biosynthesis